jgi:hypothetical protein
MAYDVDIRLVEDTGTPAVEELVASVRPSRVQDAVGRECVLLMQEHFDRLPHNKQGWPPVGFYARCADGTDWEPAPDGIVVESDNADAPGSLRQRFHGGPIDMVEHLLTIPNMEQFYGHRATEFTDLRLAILGGVKALVVPKAGTRRVNTATGRETSVPGTGPRAHQYLREGYMFSRLHGTRGGSRPGYRATTPRETMVAYWLVEHVDQEGDEGVIPSDQEFVATAVDAVLDLVGRSAD